MKITIHAGLTAGMILVFALPLSVGCGDGDGANGPPAPLTTATGAPQPTITPTPEPNVPVTWAYDVTYEGEHTVWTHTLACTETKNNVDSYVIEVTYDAPPARTSGGVSLVMTGMTEYIATTTLDEVADIARTKALGTLNIASESTYTYSGEHGRPFFTGVTYDYDVSVHLEPPLSPDTSRTNQLDVTGTEEVTVPAGTFNCYKVTHTRVPPEGAGSASKLLREEYWAVDVDLLAPVKVVELGNWDAPETRELLSVEGLTLPLPSFPTCSEVMETGTPTATPSKTPTPEGTPTAPVPTIEPPEAAVKIQGPSPEYWPMVCGTSLDVGGTYVWTDYAYDDRGANTQGGDLSNPATAGGDAVYPAWAAPGNAADLIQLQIGEQEGNILVRAVLETLTDAQVPLLGVAFDTDGDAETGAATAPGGGWVADGPLGIEKLVVVAADGAEVWSYGDVGWSASEPFAATVDPNSNSMETVVPHSMLAFPQHGAWRVFGVLGIRNAAGGSWLDGQELIYDLAFVGNEPEYGWQDRRQADILAGALASSNAAVAIDFDVLHRGATEVANPLAPGFHTYLYRSQLQLGEGIVTRSDGTHEFNGPYQPYLIYVPEIVTEGRPLTIFLHGANGNHLGSVFNFPDGNYIGTGRMLSEELFVIAPFAVDGTDFPPNAVTVYPLGRGETMSYRDAAEQDVLDVTDDAIRRVGSDPDHVALSGASMGGMGTFRIGALYPDRWSVAIPIIGYARDSFDLLENFRNLPVRQINGFKDPLVNYAPAQETAERLHELGMDHYFWLLYERGHEGGGFVYQCVYDEAKDYVRNENPAHIVYRLDPSMSAIDETIGLNLRHDSAYWMSGIRAEDESTICTVDVTSEALPRWEQHLSEVDSEFDNRGGGWNLCGPDPAMQPTKDTWHELSWVVSNEDLLPQANSVTATLENVAAVTFDLNRAGIGMGEEASISLSTDGPSSLTVKGLSPGHGVSLDGSEAGTSDDEGVATIEIPSGNHAVTVGD
jgi:predicted esterase